MPEHVAQQRAQAAAKRTIPLRRPSERAEAYDVFRRINMHDGAKDVCWEWKGAHGLGTRGEYRPRVVIGRRDYYVYRIVYELYTGYKLQKHEVVRHQCDNSWCCNPYHMLIGTQKDNVQDMLKRERVGLKHFHVRRIMQMLEIGCTTKYVSEKMREGYNLSLDASVIRKIRLRNIYKHIEWPWGDEYARQREARAKAVQDRRLASVSQCATIDNNENTETTNEIEKGETSNETD
jgi:hypothetical protein